MTLIVLALIFYFLNGGKSFLVPLGVWLLIEHYIVWERWDAYDFLLGHEYWGLYILSLGYILGGNIYLLGVSVIGFFIGATYNKFNPFKEFIPTIKELFQ